MRADLYAAGDQYDRPAIDACSSCDAAASTPLLASALVSPDHQAKSSTVAGPRVVKYLSASSNNAASRSKTVDPVTRSSSRPYVNCFPRRAPLQITPSSSARIMTAASRRESVIWI